MSLKSKFNRSILALVLSLFVVSGVVFIKPEPAKAILVEDFVNLAVNIKDTVWKLAKSAVEHAGTVLFKNTTKYFLNNLAYNAATAIVEGGTGKTPLFPKLQPGDMLKQAAGDALGEFIDGAIGEAGLENFDICNPASMKTTINILLPSFREVDPNAFTKDSPYKAKCHWQDIKKNWTEFKEAATKDPTKYLLGVKAQFKEGANDLDIQTQISSNLLNKQQESKAAAQLNLIANQYINPVVSPISKFIKTPASVVSGSFQNSIDKSSVAETTFTNDLWADALGIFTNTLAAKLQKKIMGGLDDNSLPASKITLKQINSFISPTKKGVDQFADFKVINATRSGDAGMDAFEKFSSERLPLQGDNSLTKGPGATSEVLPDFVMVAARQELTVKQAVDQGIIPPNIQFGFSKQNPLNTKVAEDYVDNDIQNDDGNWSSGLSYRGLLIGRTQRVFPQSWELAALYWRYYDNKASGPLTIKSVMDCFADTNPGISPYGTRYSEDPRYPEKCRRDMNGNGTIDDLNPMEDYNPYFHLVDPNWVLKLPATKCLAKGSGSELVYESLQCSEDNVNAGNDANANPNKISNGEGTAICDAEQAKKLGMNLNGQEIAYDIPTKTITRDDNYCADWQSCIKEDNNGKCTSYGYCVEEKPVTKLNANGCAFPTDSNNGFYSSCDSMQIAGQQYNLVKNTLKKCLDTDAGCKQYATKMKSNNDGGLDWDLSDNNATVFLNKNATECDKTNDGCTKVAPYSNGMNLVYNGDFSEMKIGATVPSGWLVQKENASSVCEFKQKFNNEAGATLDSDGVDACSVVNETPFLVTPGYDYLLNFKIKTEGVGVAIRVDGVDATGAVLDSDTINATSSAEWTTLSYKISLGANYTDLWTFPLNTKGLVVKFTHDGPAGKIGINEVELKVANGPLVDVTNINKESDGYQTDYTGTDLVSYKLPPKYLSCELFYQKLGNYDKAACVTNNGVWNEKMNMCAVGGRSECDNFAPLCSAEDVGCQLFKTADGSLSVPAKVSGDDICPNECIGYDSYGRQPSFFEANEYPSLYSTAASCQEAGGSWDASKSSCVAQPRYVNLIPDSATQCSAAAVGCQSFTNLSSSANGGEQREYFSFLRPCVTETASSTSKVFYTWEGSDTSGYQLKKWTRLVSNLGNGPCTNVDADTGACLDTGNGAYWSNGATAGNRALCTKDDLDNNTDCRDFFDINDKHYFVYQSKTVISRPAKTADSCVSYRNDLTGKIYNADPADAVRCSEAEVGCRAFKGGTSNNIRTVFESKFDGQFDGWKNTDYTTGGLSIYNDSLRQGGSSLLVNVSNDKVSYKTDSNFIDADKEYTLVILAKKVTVTGNKEPINGMPISLFKGVVSKAVAQTVQEPMTFTYDGNLQNEWREYRIGPIVAKDVLDNEIKLKINNLGAQEGFALDEVRLLEGRDIYYLVDKTWETPISCDNPINNLQGCDVNGENCGQRLAEGAQLGCQEYLDKKENSVAIKAFTQLCSPAAVDCQAFIDTSNSKSPATFSDIKTCDTTNGVIKNGYCLMSGVEVCKVATGTSCSYSTATVPADKLIYFVPSDSKSCNQQYAGCMAMGKPGYDLTEVPAKITKFDTVYLLNNPDKYSDILCSAGGLMCEVMVASDGSQGVYVSPIGADENTSRLCVYDSGRGRWVEKANAEKDCEIDNPISASNRSKYMTPSSNVNYRGWVGMCESDYVGCKEYRNPEQAITSGANWCDATVSASEYGVCDTQNGDALSATPGGDYCKKKISGLDHLVCRLGDSGTLVKKCNYTSTDWTCFGQEKIEKGRDENGVCQIGGNDVCVIKSNGNGVQDTLSCMYSPLCSSSFAIGTSVKQCSGGQVDRGAGCAPFYDVSLNTLSSAAKATKDKGVLVSCDESAKPGEEKYCNTNVVLENRLTRQCSEWLYCTSGAKIGDKNVCFDVGRCAEADAKGNCIKPSTKMNTSVKNQTYKFENIFDRENVRYSTGYSRTGLEWSSNKAIQGYASPEAMSQSSGYSSLINGDFEEIGSAGVINGWKVINNDGDCVLSDYTKMFDGKDAWDGYYSLKIDKKKESGFCSLYSNSGDGRGPDGTYYLPFNAKRRYVLSFAAKSSTGDQVAMAGLAFYDNDYNVCSLVATQAGFNAAIPATARERYASIGTYEGQTMYYNKYCVDKNGSTTLSQSPSWIWGYLTKINKIKKNWTTYTVPFDPNSFDAMKGAPANASYVKIVVFGPHPGWGDYKGDKGAIWLDDINLDSSLQLSEDRYTSSMCRLYPSADAKQCSYTKFNRDYKGWNGYCLEEDPYAPGQCLQWFPIDSIGSDGLNDDNEQLQAYDNRPSLYMCVASTGVYNRAATISMNNKLCQATWQTGGTSIGATFDGGSRFADIHNAKVWLEKTTCDDYNTDDWSGMWGAKDLAPGYYMDGTKKLPALWWGGAQTGSSYKGREQTGDFGYDNNFSLWWNEYSHPGCPWSWGGSCNKAGVGVLFNEDGSFRSALWFDQDGSGDTGGLYFNQIAFYPKDECRLMARVVDSNGENKVVQSAYNNGWTTDNPMGYSKSTPGSPFGSLIIKDGLSSVEPSLWSSSNVPFNFEASNVGMPLYALRSVPSGLTGAAYCQLNNDPSGTQWGQDQICQGSEIKNISAYQCSYCAGVGKYKYDTTSGVNIMRSTRCDNSDSSDCLAPKELHPSSIGNFEPADNIYKTGIDRLQRLFAKVYGWYELVYSQGKAVYKKVDFSSKYYNDVSRDRGASGIISSIKVADKSTNNVNVDAPGQSLTVTFKVDIPDEQLPIRRLYIDWGDGTQPNEFNGEFNERSSDGNPFTFSHWYGCVPTADGNRCRACTKPGVLPGVDGSCQYDGPKILAQDNWEWCAVPLGADIGTKYGSSLCRVPNELVPYDGGRGKIIIKPRE